MYLIFLCYAILGSAISVNKVILQWMPTALFVGIRMLGAGILMTTYAYFTTQRITFDYVKKDFWRLLAAALLTTFLPTLLKAFALKHMFSSKATLIGSCDPFVTALYAYILWDEKLSWTKLLGILIGFTGVAFTTISAISPDEQTWQAWFVFSYPELAAIGTVFLGRLGWILTRSLLKKERFTPFEVNGLSMLMSGTFALITSCFVDQWHTISISSISHFALLMIYTIIVGNIIGYTLYAYVIKHYNFTLVSLAGFTVPVVVGIIGFLFLSEPISYRLLICATLVFFGLVIFYYDDFKQNKKTA